MGNTRLSPLQRAATIHNRMIGLAVAIQKQAVTVANCPTANERAQSLARLINANAHGLEQALRAERKD